MQTDIAECIATRGLRIQAERTLDEQELLQDGEIQVQYRLPTLPRGMEQMEAQYEPEDYLVVIPSIRPVNPEYLEALKAFDICIADDSDGKVDRRHLTQH